MPIPGHGLPVSLVLDGRDCLVVGGGQVARRKAETLVGCGARVTMVASEFSVDVAELGVEALERPYAVGEAANYHLVIAATGDPAVDRQIAADAARAGALVNVADDPEFCTFILPAVHRMGHVSVAVSTDGHSPALATWLRDRIASELDHDVAALAERLAAVRGALAQSGVSSTNLDWRGLIEALRATDDPDATTASWLDEQRRITVLDEGQRRVV